jgi:hypothetical protein
LQLPGRWHGRLGTSSGHQIAADGPSTLYEDSLLKAMRLQAIRKLDAPTGTSNQSSFLSFDNARITSDLHNIGFKLGRNAKEIVVSTNVLKHVEIDKLKVSPKVMPKDVFNNSDDENADAIHDGQLLSHLVGGNIRGGFGRGYVGIGSLDDLKTN